MIRRVGFIVVIASTVLVVTPGVSFADTAGQTVTQLDGTVPSHASKRLNRPLVSGIVDDASGQPLANAPVSLLMWPSNDVLQNQVVGDAVNLQTVAEGTTNADGTFALLVTSAQTLLQGADTSGLVNFDVVAGDGN